MQIQAALDAAGAGETVWLLPGTYNVTATLTQGASTILRGFGWSTIVDVGGVAAADNAITMGASGEVRDLKIVGDVSVLETEGRALQAANNAVIDTVWISNNNYGMSAVGCTTVTISNVRFDNILGVNGWGACVHSGAGTDGVIIDGITVTDCDRGIETENGAQNVTASNGTMVRVAASPYSFTLDAHTHLGLGQVDTVTYENFTLTECMPITALGVNPAERTQNVTFRNIVIVDPNLTGSLAYAVVLTRADHITIDGITISGIGAGDALSNTDTTDVTGLGTIQVI